jgi:quercetin dioxygenase-like cupin family protein
MALEHAKQGQVVNLASLGEAAHSTALVKTEQFEAIHLVVAAGATLPSHSVGGQATLQCLKGRVRLTLGDDAVELAEGDWLYLDRDVEHGAEGLEDAAILLTILF